MASDLKIYSMSVRNPWAYLIAKGYKKIENRHTGISDTKYNEPIALHVSNKSYNEKDRHKYYALPVVQKCLKTDNKTKNIYNKYNKLDQFFSTMTGSIIAIVYINNTIKSKENKQISKYQFANVPKGPKQALYHWIISKQIYLLPAPIQKYRGNLGVLQMENKNAVKTLKTFLREKQIENHLFIPEHILRDPMQLIRYDSNGNTIRLIYDDIKADTDTDSDVDMAENDKNGGS
eukprot:UN04103